MKINELTPSEMFTQSWKTPEFRVVSYSGSRQFHTYSPQSLTEQFNIEPDSIELRALARLINNPALMLIRISHNISVTVMPSDESRQSIDWKLRTITNFGEPDTEWYLTKYGDDIQRFTESDDVLSSLIIDVANGIAFSFNKDLARKLTLSSSLLRTELFDIGLYPEKFELIGRRCPLCKSVFAAPVGVKFGDVYPCLACATLVSEHYNGVAPLYTKEN